MNTVEQTIRENVIRSLSAIGAITDARFYAELFASQASEKFALLVIDPRCLKNPLLESLIGNLRLLIDLGLTPTILIGALSNFTQNVSFQSQRLVRDLRAVKVRVERLNTASYALLDAIKKSSAAGKITVLENTGHAHQQELEDLVSEIRPAKVIFLQPSGGITQNGQRISVINIDDKKQLNLQNLSVGQSHCLQLARSFLERHGSDTVYVLASPLNLLQELFTVKGSGTLIRHGAKITVFKTLRNLDLERLQASIELGFDKPLRTQIADWPIAKIYLDSEYRGGAIFTRSNELTYLSKFWVEKTAQGEGFSRDIWEGVCKKEKQFYWRSRMDNPFNDWYMRACDGMQLVNQWRVFWRGLSPNELTEAIVKAPMIPVDF